MDGYDGIYLQGAEYVNFKPDEDSYQIFWIFKWGWIEILLF